ncbi:MAG: tRNA 2-thiouridine(34) synthase MnmA [Firmicutes bacterium]|nr:tRNA 2-thiouridine(34) synthase MnmA [Bacillota bacterium]
MSRGRMLVAMSGGVDSSVVAALMVGEGWDVVGVTLQLRSCDDRMASRSCCSADGISQARAVAGSLGIPHYVLDCRETFLERVMRPAWAEYEQGRTPSPCLHCNREMKFGYLGEYADRLGAERIATGHYARVEREGDQVRLLRGVDRAKDQSYFLSQLSLAQVRRLELPLGAMTKPEVRALARSMGLVSAERHESQDICLTVEGLGFPESLRQRFEEPSRAGSFVTPDGKALGPHEGFHRYTLGQRRGLGLALGERAHVVGLRPEDAAVIVSTDEHDLLASGLRAVGVQWIAEPAEQVYAQIRSRHAGAPARLELHNTHEVIAHFDTPQSAVTPGQAVAFYLGEQLLGGGWIDAALKEPLPPQ